MVENVFKKNSFLIMFTYLFDATQNHFVAKNVKKRVIFYVSQQWKGFPFHISPPYSYQYKAV